MHALVWLLQLLPQGTDEEGYAVTEEPCGIVPPQGRLQEARSDTATQPGLLERNADHSAAIFVGIKIAGPQVFVTFFKTPCSSTTTELPLRI
ncbi:hypothetical protein HYX06_03110 [Candidatus Woesearchaeota archaeon]|nr:hypothetical protein [Candidatus Woesearchaeota archaeon]